MGANLMMLKLQYFVFFYSASEQTETGGKFYARGKRDKTG